MEKTAIIVLNYNGAEDTLDCIKSIRRVALAADIIVVDNASAKDNLQLLTERLPSDITFLTSDVNLGYAGGNNIGIRYAYDKGYQYICILNNDTVVSEDFLSPCVEELEKNPDISFIGPTIVNYTDGLVQCVGGNIYINRAYVDCHHFGTAYNPEPKMLVCDYIGGACMVFRRAIVEQLGVIPESYFLFYEETEWCYRAVKAGYRNICLNTVKLQHKGSVSVTKIGGLTEYLMTRNKIAFLRRNHPVKAVAFFIYLALCAKAFLATVLKGRNNLPWIRYYSHGWFKIVDLKKYPFIIINE